ncbi:hypothetical protein ScalyP_jg2511 [Parmales sp. scaly parma]|nr:hypothetical protein ScalyP_jg2511 [Parmales sp. scaly parma]
MFYVKKLSIELPLEPKFFGANLSTALSKIIISKLEGTVQEDYGTLVKVIEVFVDDMSASGVIEHDTGRVHFNVSYQGLFMRCFKNEIVDFEVSNVNELGFFGMIGPMRMLVTTYQMTEEYTWNKDRESYITEDGEIEIRQGVGVRCRVIGSRVEGDNFSCMGTIVGDFLGLIDEGDSQGAAFSKTKAVTGGHLYSEQNVPGLSDQQPQLFTASLHLIGEKNPTTFLLCPKTNKVIHVLDPSTLPQFFSQSCMKPLVYAMALQKGHDVHKVIGTTGDIGYANHNLDGKGRALNPLINTGSLTMLELLGREYTKEEIARYCQNLGNIADNTTSPAFSEEGYVATKKDSMRNQYIAKYLACNGVIPKTAQAVESAVDNYAALDCLLFNTSQLSTIGFNLANKGGDRMTQETANSVLSMMMHCGMYESSGEWSKDVGVCAKSGVSGSIFASIPGVGGIGVFSPEIDEFGNSVRGMAFVKEFLAECPELKMFW